MPMRSDESIRATRIRRARAANILLLAAMALLAGAFFRLQVIGAGEFRLQSENNRVRPIPIPPPRGSIYDRRGRLLAENIPGYSLSILPSSMDSARATLVRLAPYLDLGEGEIQALIDKFRRQPQLPLMVHDDLDFGQVAAIEQRRPQFRLAVIDTHPRRRYPAGSATAHVIGYVGEISETELEQPEFGEYEAGRTVGKKGVERQYEASLAGSPGVRFVEVSAKGSIVSEFGPRPTVPAVPGDDLTLALDLALQQYTDSIFPAGKRGGVVAIDPSSGEVLLLYSRPTFDTNLFIGGISESDWSQLINDPAQPLLNRATSALYPPGSTWKLVVSTLGLRSGIATIAMRMPTTCRGALQYGRRPFRCWRPEGHGSLDLSGAIKESCNVFFYQFGLRIGLDALLSGVDGLGFNTATGLDLPAELAGRFPASREWYDQRFGRRGWTEAVTLNLSIGQGENEQTLMRMVQFYSALATGQSPVVPHLWRNEALETRREPWSLQLPEARRGELVHALTRVVNEPGGTAWWHRPTEWTMAGKTGTAQNPFGEPHSWFIGFAPVDAPRIVVAAVVENGHPDNQTSLAVPLASKLVQRYLLLEDVPPDPPPPAPATPVEHPEL
jgi:penicillin-binding protein 2